MIYDKKLSPRQLPSRAVCVLLDWLLFFDNGRLVVVVISSQFLVSDKTLTPSPHHPELPSLGTQQ